MKREAYPHIEREINATATGERTTPIIIAVAYVRSGLYNKGSAAPGKSADTEALGMVVQVTTDDTAEKDFLLSR